MYSWIIFQNIVLFQLINYLKHLVGPILFPNQCNKSYGQIFIGINILAKTIFRKPYFKQMMYIGLMLFGQIVTFGAAALVVISDTHSYTSKICTKQNLYMQDVLFYYNNQTVNVFLQHI
jgi:hypothetical protein